MKKYKTLILIILVSTVNVTNASLKYECSRYVGGVYQGWTTIIADNKTEAEEKAINKFRNKLGKKVENVKCK